jgi:hypothetical protein
MSEFNGAGHLSFTVPLKTQLKIERVVEHGSKGARTCLVGYLALLLTGHARGHNDGHGNGHVRDRRVHAPHSAHGQVERPVFGGTEEDIA